MGRVVLTHSTYIEGLIPRLKKLSELDSIKTVTPGELKRTKGRSFEFKLRVSTKIIGGYKMIARRGNSVQEVFVITSLDKPTLELILKEQKM